MCSTLVVLHVLVCLTRKLIWMVQFFLWSLWADIDNINVINRFKTRPVSFSVLFNCVNSAVQYNIYVNVLEKQNHIWFNIWITMQSELSALLLQTQCFLLICHQIYRDVVISIHPVACHYTTAGCHPDIILHLILAFTNTQLNLTLIKHQLLR